MDLSLFTVDKQSIYIWLTENRFPFIKLALEFYDSAKDIKLTNYEASLVLASLSVICFIQITTCFRFLQNYPIGRTSKICVKVNRTCNNVILQPTNITRQRIFCDKGVEKFVELQETAMEINEGCITDYQNVKMFAFFGNLQQFSERII